MVIPITASTGADSGTLMLQNILSSEAPSSCAASKRGSGRLSKNPFSMKIEKPLAIVGNISAQYVLSRCRSLMSR